MSQEPAEDFWAKVTGKPSQAKTVEKAGDVPATVAQSETIPFAQTDAKLPTQSPASPIPPPVTNDPFAPSTQSKIVEETAAKPSNIPFSPQATAPSSTVTDPFAPATISQKVESEVGNQAVVSTPSLSTTAPTSSPPTTQQADPFAGTNKKCSSTSPEEEFKKMRPASAGKNFSFMIYDGKGTGKTVLALSLPGRIFAVSMDQQTAIIHQDFFNSDPRIVVWDGIEFFNSKDPTTKLETAVKTMEYINWLLENSCKEFAPDWILIDGTERLNHVCEMAMRAQENLMPYEGPKNLNVWKSRNDKVNNIVQRATQLAKLGVIYTAYATTKTVTTAQGEIKRECPKWFGDVEQKTQIVIKTSSEKVAGGTEFIAYVESSKTVFMSTGRKAIVGERLDTGEVKNRVGIKVLFTPEGVQKFFSEVKQ